MIVTLLNFNLILTLSVILLKPSTLQSQILTKSTISGTVIDFKTGKPIYFANIFLSNTTLGCATDKNGYYTITNIPSGNYEIVASTIGYEVENRKITITNPDDMIIDFELRGKVIKGEEVTVIAEQPTEWRNKLKVFNKLLFGIKSSANECVILNPEFMDFQFNTDSNTFQAFTEEPIIFENRALGYKITLLLERFHVLLSPTNKSFIYYNHMSFMKSFLELEGQKRFEELNYTNERERRRWERNRLKAYNGSLRHFLKSLFENNLQGEGFKIRGTKLSKPGKLNDTYLFDSRNDYKVKTDSLLLDTDDPFLRILKFSDYLKVIYSKEANEITNLENQISWLKISNGNQVIINANGFFIADDKVFIISHGYWFWYSADEWLPYNYQ